MSYQDAVNNVFASGTIANGYFGDRSSCQFSLLNGIVVAVHSFGFHRVLAHPVVDAAEALWMLEHHPSCRNITVTSVGA